ncbi:MAG: hypothetical protein AAFX09_12690 [Pseudomonadota bacterium]
MRLPVKSVALLAALAIALIALSSCTQARWVLQTAPDIPPGPAAAPPLLAEGYGGSAVLSQQDWSETRAPALRAAFAEHVYGPIPPTAPVIVLNRREVDPAAFNGAGRLEEITLRIETGPEPVQLTLALALPNTGAAPFPLFILPNDCGPAYALRRPDLAAPAAPSAPWCSPEGPDSAGMAPAIGRFLFGRYALTPPAETLLRRGYAFAVYHDADFAPDSSRLARPALARFAESRETGVIAGWAWGVSRLLDGLEADPRLDIDRSAVMGHSRRGKMALLAAAYDPRLAVTIAHQSGTGGASLTRGGRGEPLAEMVEAYPHWFTPTYAGYAGREEALPVDQHQLIALAAPRAVLIGNAWRDTWADPASALRAVQGAAPAWALFGEPVEPQDRLRDWRPDQPFAFHIRPGTHGITPEDWAAFLEFADAHLAQ